MAGNAVDPSVSATLEPMLRQNTAASTPSEPAVPEPQPRLQTTTTTTPPRPSLDPMAVISAVRGVEGAATVGAVVFDRTAGAELLALEPDRQFRSASLVKLLIAIDALSRGANDAQRRRISVMLRLSDDDIASSLWVRGGGPGIVSRTSASLGLAGTLPPKNPGQWGDALLTPRDVGRVYQFVLTSLAPADRALIVDSLAGAPRLAADGFDQHFGIPSVLAEPWAIKQGWSNSRTDIVVHTSGLVGADWRYVVVLLTEHPLRVSWRTAANSVTEGTRALVPVF